MIINIDSDTETDPAVIALVADPAYFGNRASDLGPLTKSTLDYFA